MSDIFSEGILKFYTDEHSEDFLHSEINELLDITAEDFTHLTHKAYMKRAKRIKKAKLRLINWILRECKNDKNISFIDQRR